VSRPERSTRPRLARRRGRLLATALLLALAPGRGAGDDPGDLGSIDRGLYEASGAVAPSHPVTGRPVLNVVPEALEVRLARDFFRQYAEQARARGAAVDPPGARLDRVRAIFAGLVSVAHRPQLPWEVHLVDDPSTNAFTAGGGLVVVLSGLWNGMLGEADDAGLAVVLAHEIAHVALLHPPTRVTWLGVGGVVSPGSKDPYYRAAYSHEQEAEADRLSTLYLALAGYDPLAAARLWTHAAERGGDSAARAGYLHDHPPSSERVRITSEAGHAVRRYWQPGRRHPHHREILADNVLYPRTRDDGYHPGAGIVRAASAVLDGFRVHRRASRSRDERLAAARDQSRVRVIGTWHAPTEQGEPGLVLDVWNGADRAVASLGLSLSYWSRGALLLIEECHGDVSIGPRSTRTLTCPRQGMDADRIEPLVIEVSWR
jgi:Zn-dependent protease with chaperone function